MEQKNKNNLISFILPYHKVEFENNIKKLINNIFRNFTDINYEILLVKNKTYNFSITLIKNLQLRNKIRHIKILNKKMYDIRLEAIKKADAKYISFIDVDDNYCFENLANNLDQIINKNYDINIFDTLATSQVRNKDKTHNNIIKYPSDSAELNYHSLLQKSLVVTNGLFKKKLVKNINIKLDISYDEDVALMTQMCLNNSTILHIKAPFLNTSNTNNSLTRTFEGIQLEAITVNQALESITNKIDFQILLFRFVCSKLIDIKLIDNKIKRRKSYNILKKYIKSKYNKKIINKVIKNKFIIISCKPWFISLIIFLVPRKLLKKIVCKNMMGI